MVFHLFSSFWQSLAFLHIHNNIFKGNLGVTLVAVINNKLASNEYNLCIRRINATQVLRYEYV